MKGEKKGERRAKGAEHEPKEINVAAKGGVERQAAGGRKRLGKSSTRGKREERPCYDKHKEKKKYKNRKNNQGGKNGGV